MLISYHRGRYSTTSVAMNFRNNRVPAAEVGDFVAYDWDGNGSTDHVAFIVNIAAGQYPEVSEWGVGSGSRTAYQKRGWTYSKVHGTWLQATYPSVKATLIHINGGHY